MTTELMSQQVVHLPIADLIAIPCRLRQAQMQSHRSVTMQPELRHMFDRPFVDNNV